MIGVDGDRAEVIAKYRVWLAGAVEDDARVREAIRRIALAARSGEVTLLCHCAPAPCHAEVVAQYAERLNERL